MKLTIFKVNTSVAFSTHTWLCNYQHSHHPKGKPQVHQVVTPIPSISSPWQLLIYFLSLWIFYINGIIHLE